MSSVLSQEKYPEDYANRDEDKFNYRYRGGEVGPIHIIGWPLYAHPLIH